MIVTSRGILTSCNEVLRPDDSRSSYFQYGSWDEATSKFNVDHRRIARLASLKVHNIRKCEGCFAKYNCAGDCYAKTYAEQGKILSSTYTKRCIVTRELLRDNLAIELAKGARAALVGAAPLDDVPEVLG